MAAKMAAWLVESKAGQKAVQKVENSAGLMAVSWAVCSVAYWVA